MKKILFILSIAFGISLHAQITLTRGHIINYGKKFIIAYDENLHAFAASGANKTWDFSDINANYRDTLRFGGADWYKGYSNFPKANYGFIYNSDPMAINFLRLDDSAFSLEGYYNYTPGSEESSNSRSTLIRFPSTFQSSFSESHIFQGSTLRIKTDPDTAGPMPFIDSLRIDMTRFVFSNIDGWGTLKTPLGSFATLKQTTLDVMAQTYMMKSAGTWKSAPNNILKRLNFPLPNFDSSYNVNFWTNNSNYGYPLMTYYYGPRDNGTYDIEWMFSAPKASALATSNVKNLSFFPNPSNSDIHISGDVSNVELEVCDLQGRCLYKYNDLNQTIQLGHLNTGVYILQFKDSITHNMINTQRFVKS
jgi:hypothetical protein